MRNQGVYGQSLGDHFHLDDAPAIITKTLKRSEVAVTHIKCRKPSLTSSIPTEDAYLVAYQIEDCIDHELWINGKGTGRLPFFGGQTSFYDLREDPTSYIGETSNCMMYYLPKSAIDTIAEEHGKRFGELRMRSDKPADDPIIAALSTTLMPAFANPEYASQLFLDHTTLAVASHIAHRYGGLHAIRKIVAGGLSARNERRAREIIDANLAGEVSLADLATQCELSPRHFARAFKQSMGVPAHHWMVMRRCERAKELLRDPGLPISDIAISCGFADQSHFTRTFTRVVGISPGAWRKAV
jgi:AraC-like DNA-binding protein